MAMNDLFRQQHIIANDNAKLIISSFATWFTFFWTLNLAAMGYLYSPQAAQQISKFHVLLSAIFFLLNVLGIGVCYYCWKSISQLREEAVAAVKSWIALENGASSIEFSAGLLPIRISNYVFLASEISLLLNLVAWGILPFIS